MWTFSVMIVIVFYFVHQYSSRDNNKRSRVSYEIFYYMCLLASVLSTKSCFHFCNISLLFIVLPVHFLWQRNLKILRYVFLFRSWLLVWDSVIKSLILVKSGKWFTSNCRVYVNVNSLQYFLGKLINNDFKAYFLMTF